MPWIAAVSRSSIGSPIMDLPSWIFFPDVSGAWPICPVVMVVVVGALMSLEIIWNHTFDTEMAQSLTIGWQTRLHLPFRTACCVLFACFSQRDGGTHMSPLEGGTIHEVCAAGGFNGLVMPCATPQASLRRPRGFNGRPWFFFGFVWALNQYFWVN